VAVRGPLHLAYLPYCCIATNGRNVPLVTKVRRSKLPSYSISSSATANLRVAAALLAV
jgi:hypothetical protein